MRWASLRIPVNGLDHPDASDAATNLLLSAGTDGVSLAIGAYDEVTDVTGYIPDDERLNSRLIQIQAALSMIPDLGIKGVGQELIVGYVEEEDWANAWKQYFKPIRVGRHFIVSPPWENPELAAHDKLLIIDPGMAFGTGTHPTTQLCLACLEDYIPKTGINRLADIGTGSGILSIGAKNARCKLCSCS